MTTELQKPDHPAIHGKTEVSALVRLAVEKDLDVEKLEKLFALYERDQKRVAEQEFHAALADFQAKCPPIRKSTTKEASRDGGPSYSYAELDEIVRTIQPLLHRLGFSYTWDMPQGPKDGLIDCVCRLRHVKGHSLEARFMCPFATKAGMSEQQKYASALTYARRYSLIQVLGLSTTEKDHDGVYPEHQHAPPAGNGSRVEAISIDQLSQIEQKLGETKKPEKLLLGWVTKRTGVPVQTLAEIPAWFYEDVIAKLDATIAAEHQSAAPAQGAPA